MDDTRTKGRIGEIRVIDALLRKGYIVSEPHTQAPYDLIADDGDNLHKIQVKCAKSDGSMVECSLTRVGYNSNGPNQTTYDETEVDAYCFYCRDKDCVLWLDFEDAPSTSATFRFEDPENGQQSGIRMADNYIL